jgi:hypothetical protein
MTIESILKEFNETHSPSKVLLLSMVVPSFVDPTTDQKLALDRLLQFTPTDKGQQVIVIQSPVGEAVFFALRKFNDFLKSRNGNDGRPPTFSNLLADGRDLDIGPCPPFDSYFTERETFAQLPPHVATIASILGPFMTIPVFQTLQDQFHLSQIVISGHQPEDLLVHEPGAYDLSPFDLDDDSGSDDNRPNSVEGDTEAEVKAESESKSSGRKKREDPWSKDEFYCKEVHTREELELKLNELGAAEFGWCQHLDKYIHWMLHGKPATQKKTGNVVQKLRCAYFFESNCQYCIKTIKNGTTKEWCIQVGLFPHADHSFSNSTRGLSKMAKALAAPSPSKLLQAPRKMLADLRKRNVTVNSTTAKSAVRYLHRARQHSRGDHLNGNQDAETYGAVLKTLEMYDRKNIDEEDFTEHSTFILDKVVDVNKRTVVAVLSTENLLLNAYRQRFFSQPLFFACDISYRYMKEGWGIYPIITVNLSQQSKTIAYGFLSKEHTDAQDFIFRTLRTGVENIVNKRIAEHKNNEEN